MSLGYGPYLTAGSRCSLTTATGGACTKLRRKYARPRPHTWQAPRGKVREFSRRSRTRLMQTLCALPIRHVRDGVLFLTLTYPANYPGEWAVWKRQLDTFLKRLRRRHPTVGGTWKLEPQERGAPHYHLLLVGVRYVARDWIKSSWSMILGTADPWHYTYGARIELAKSHRGVIGYAAKYTAKQERLPESWQEGVGRWWGVFGRAQLEIAWAVVPLTQAEFFACTRAVRQLLCRRQKTAARAPPRANASGSWAALTDTDALRLALAAQGADFKPTPHRRRLSSDDGCAQDIARTYRS